MQNGGTAAVEDEVALLRAQNAALLAQNAALLTHMKQAEQAHNPSSVPEARINNGVRDHQHFLDLMTVQPPRPPLRLPVITQERISHVAESLYLGVILYRLVEVEHGRSLAELLAEINLEAMWNPENIVLGVSYSSSKVLTHMRCDSLAMLRASLLRIWINNSAWRNEWHGLLRNLLSGRLHAILQTGVIYQDQTEEKASLFHTTINYVCAELDPISGKTYLVLLRRPEVMELSDPLVRSTAMHNMMALKYSPNLILMVSDDGRIRWQNSAACAAMGTLASELTFPVRGCCDDIVDLDYLEQLFWGEEALRREMERITAAGHVFQRRIQINGPELRRLLGASSRREVWHQVRSCKLKDPTSHELVFVMSQNDITDVVLAERRVKQLQKQQQHLLKEMLPQQVIDVLLSEHNQQEPGLGPRSSVADASFHHLFAAGTASMAASAESCTPYRSPPASSGGAPALHHQGAGDHVIAATGHRRTSGSGVRSGAHVAFSKESTSGATGGSHEGEGKVAGAWAREALAEDPVLGLVPEPAVSGSKLARGRPLAASGQLPEAEAGAGAGEEADAEAAACALPGARVAALPTELGVGGALTEAAAAREGGPRHTAGISEGVGGAGAGQTHAPPVGAGLLLRVPEELDLTVPSPAAGTPKSSMGGLTTALQAAIDSCPIMGEYCIWTKSDRLAREVTRRQVKQSVFQQGRSKSMGRAAFDSLMQQNNGAVPSPFRATGKSASLAGLLHGAKDDKATHKSGPVAQRLGDDIEEELEGVGSLELGRGHEDVEEWWDEERQVPGSSQQDGQGQDEQRDKDTLLSRHHHIFDAEEVLPDLFEADQDTTAGILSHMPSLGLHSVGSASRSVSRDGSGLQLSRRDVMALATWHEEVTILFTDLKGFTSMSSSLHPAQIMLFLNHLYSLFDDLVSQFDVYKVETIGDSYMVAGGLFDRSTTPGAGEQSPQKTSAVAVDAPCGDVLLGAEIFFDQASLDSRADNAVATPRRNILGGRDPDHATKVLAFAKAMSATAASVTDPLGNRVQMRVGIHTGSVMSGVVGRKCPRFCLFGDTVNTASRMESTGEPGRIHVSQEFRDLLPDQPWEACEVFAKGKGKLTTYFLDWQAQVDSDAE